MALPSSGQISFDNIRTELQYASGAAISLNDSLVRNLLMKSSGQISLSDGYGKSSGYNFTPTINTNTTDYVLRNQLISNGWNGVSPVNVTITIASGIYLYASSTSVYALNLGNLSTGSRVTLINNGYILGRGGNGGNSAYGPGGSGYGGGPAVFVSSTTLVTIINNGVIGGGGGGGGAGGGVTFPIGKGAGTTLGTTGGGGIVNGLAGVPAYSGVGVGTNGTLTSAGLGATRRGPFGVYSAAYTGNAGNGGSYGSSGASGTAASGGSQNYAGGSGGPGGAAIVGSSYVTFSTLGNVYGALVA